MNDNNILKTIVNIYDKTSLIICGKIKNTEK